MKLRRCVVLVYAFLLLTACGQPAPPSPREPVARGDLKRFTDGYFAVSYPDWPEDPDPAPESVLGVVQGSFGVWVNHYEAVPALAARATREHLATQRGAEILSQSRHNGSPLLEYRLPSEDTPLRFRALLVYCQGHAYAATVAGAEETFDQQADLFQRVLDSARCQDPVRVPRLTTGKLGMVINPARDDYEQGYYPALRLAKESGVQVSYLYLAWGQIEQEPGRYRWEWADHLMGLNDGEGFEVSLVVDVIHTTVRGQMPPDLVEVPFDDPVFIERFTTFILALLDRYPGQIAYLSIGNEVNDYFAGHRDEVASYRIFFQAVREAIAARHPGVKVAMTFAYHDAVRQGTLDIVRELNVGDFTPYTLYIYDEGFRFDREPSELEAYLERMLTLAGDKPVAVVELGWNTARSLGGSEEDQAAFVREAFRLLNRHRDRIEYLVWFTLHHGRPESCRETALSFISHRPDLMENEAFLKPFTDFLCYLGLRRSDGTPKLGWKAWQEEVEAYLE